jgi:hypothetical protein
VALQPASRDMIARCMIDEVRQRAAERRHIDSTLFSGSEQTTGLWLRRRCRSKASFDLTEVTCHHQLFI